MTALPIPSSAAYTAQMQSRAYVVGTEQGARLRADVAGSVINVDVTWILYRDQFDRLMSQYNAWSENPQDFAGDNRFTIPSVVDVPYPVETYCQFIGGSLAIQSVNGLNYNVTARLQMYEHAYLSDDYFLELELSLLEAWDTYGEDAPEVSAVYELYRDYIKTGVVPSPFGFGLWITNGGQYAQLAYPFAISSTTGGKSYVGFLNLSPVVSQGSGGKSFQGFLNLSPVVGVND